LKVTPFIRKTDICIVHDKSPTLINKDSKGVIRNGKSKRDIHFQNKEGKRTKNDQQNTTQKTKDRTTRTSLKPRVNSYAPFYSKHYFEIQKFVIFIS
jgi:hypothetical protein